MRQGRESTKKEKKNTHTKDLMTPEDLVQGKERDDRKGGEGGRKAPREQRAVAGDSDNGRGWRRHERIVDDFSDKIQEIFVKIQGKKAAKIVVIDRW